MGAALKENHRLEARWPSTEDEFSDAITTVTDPQENLIQNYEKKKKLRNSNFFSVPASHREERFGISRTAREKSSSTKLLIGDIPKQTQYKVGV